MQVCEMAMIINGRLQLERNAYINANGASGNTMDLLPISPSTVMRKWGFAYLYVFVLLIFDKLNIKLFISKCKSRPMLPGPVYEILQQCLRDVHYDDINRYNFVVFIFSQDNNILPTVETVSLSSIFLYAVKWNNILEK